MRGGLHHRVHGAAQSLGPTVRWDARGQFLAVQASQQAPASGHGKYSGCGATVLT